MGGCSEKWSCQIHRILYAMHRLLKKAPTELAKAGPAWCRKRISTSPYFPPISRFCGTV